jgi:hypothetical protein
MSSTLYLLVVTCESCGSELPAGIVDQTAKLRDLACRAVCSNCSRSYQLLARDLRQIPLGNASMDPAVETPNRRL